MTAALVETAPAKVNLILQVGSRRADGLHELCSLFASIELADTLRFQVNDDERAGDADAPDDVHCPGVEGPNLVTAALAAFRDEVAGGLPPLRVEVDKRIPVAAGLGGGSADAAAALRAANRVAGEPLAGDALERLAFEIGADVPSQLVPGHALVEGTGERVQPLSLPDMALLLVPAAEGLDTAAVYAEADRIGSTRDRLGPEGLRGLANGSLEGLAAEIANDLAPAAISLRPELEPTVRALGERAALAASISGSGPTAFGVYEDEDRAREAAAAFPAAIVTRLRDGRRRAAS